MKKTGGYFIESFGGLLFLFRNDKTTRSRIQKLNI